MAKKSAARSWQLIEEDLRSLFADPVAAEEVPYRLLRAFGRSEAVLRRYQDGKGIVKTFDGLLIKADLAFRPVLSPDALAPTLEAMKGEKLVRSASPKLLLVSDGTTILGWDSRYEESYENQTTGLWADFRFFYPLMGVERTHVVAELEADVRAAEKLGRLHDELRAYNDFASPADLHALNLFITRLLFCFFAEDTGIFSEGLFTDSVRSYTQEDGSDLADYLSAAFRMMNQRERLGLSNTIVEQFPYVNGGLFAQDAPVPTMTRRARKLILESGGLNWQAINPDIFGSMIQAVADADLRSAVGMHYTSVPNIRKVIDPLFLGELRSAYDALRRRFEEADHAFRLGEISLRERASRLKALQGPIAELLGRIGRMRFFDPACGSGNFLIITYKELRLLEMDLIGLQRDCAGEGAGLDFVGSSVVRLDQFYGIELLDFPHEVARLSLWLAEHQMNRLLQDRYGITVPALPLKSIAHIHQGNACRLDWQALCPHSPEDEVYLFGNPPYLGSRVQEAEHKADMAAVFAGEAKYKDLDYICCWFVKAAQYLQDSKAQAAFVSTNSIAQGLQVPLLWKILAKYSVEIGFAHTSFKWTNNARGNAGVTVIILSLRSPSNAPKYLYSASESKQVGEISPYLIDAPALLIEGLTKSLSGFPHMNFGNMPNDGGALLMNAAEMKHLIAQDPQAEKFIRPVLGSQELIRGEKRYCLWIEDKEVEEAEQSPEIRKRIEQCRKKRLASKDAGTKKLAERPHQFRDRNVGYPMLMIPRVSSEARDYIPMEYLDDGKTIVTDLISVIYGAPVWLFAVLTSKIHMAWVRTIGGKLKTDYRYSAQICYNTFPFPTVGAAERAQLEALAEEVLLCRADFPEKTLAELYDPKAMPVTLRAAHDAVDAFVDRLYRAEGFSSDEERLAELFRRYARAAAR